MVWQGRRPRRKSWQSMLEDARTGSVMLEVANGSATLQLQIQRSDDLSTWTSYFRGLNRGRTAHAARQRVLPLCHATGVSKAHEQIFMKAVLTPPSE